VPPQLKDQSKGCRWSAGEGPGGRSVRIPAFTGLGDAPRAQRLGGFSGWRGVCLDAMVIVDDFPATRWAPLRYITCRN
jgi:hypothetical protein